MGLCLYILLMGHIFTVQECKNMLSYHFLNCNFPVRKLSNKTILLIGKTLKRNFFVLVISDLFGNMFKFQSVALFQVICITSMIILSWHPCRGALLWTSSLLCMKWQVYQWNNRLPLLRKLLTIVFFCFKLWMASGGPFSVVYITIFSPYLFIFAYMFS